MNQAMRKGWNRLENNALTDTNHNFEMVPTYRMPISSTNVMTPKIANSTPKVRIAALTRLG